MGQGIEIHDEPRRGETFILDRCFGYATLWLSLVGCDSTHGSRRGLQIFCRSAAASFVFGCDPTDESKSPYHSSAIGVIGLNKPRSGEGYVAHGVSHGITDAQNGKAAEGRHIHS